MGSILVFTLFFFIIITTIVLNIIFGIIIDTFGEIRQKRDDIHDDIVGRCFICNIDRATFDRHAREFGGFQRHIMKEHNMWHFLSFVIMLQEKVPTEYSGPESFVANLYQSGNVSWVPLGIARSLDSSTRETNGGEQSGSGGISMRTSAAEEKSQDEKAFDHDGKEEAASRESDSKSLPKAVNLRSIVTALGGRRVRQPLPQSSSKDEDKLDIIVQRLSQLEAQLERILVPPVATASRESEQ
mmetsp:Transcript_25839/g.65348  ORF Transcript_25839/g.65348 Transcript_25839/m.65348 type:complete len:242 (+) Transcript_25839:965-1690(+)